MITADMVKMAMRSKAEVAVPTKVDSGADSGFTLIETIVSIFVITVVMAGLTTFFVTTVTMTNQQGGRQVAIQVANSAVSKVRSMKGSTLVVGRGAASTHDQWTHPVAGVASHLATMVEASDGTLPAGSTAGSTAALPLTYYSTVPAGAIQTVNGIAYTQYWYVGQCWSQAAGGTCGTTVSAVPFYRVVVAVTWPDMRCGGTCSYVTSTLVSSAPSDPVFNANATAVPPKINNPGDQLDGMSSGVRLQLTTTGGAPPLTWVITGLPPGLTMDSTGLITGILPGAPAVFNVKATVTDSLSLVGAAAFKWTVSAVGYPAVVKADSPWAYYRLEEAPTASASPVAADFSGNNRPGHHPATTNGPATWWRLDDNGTTTAIDGSGAVNPGTLTNAPVWVSGTNGSALKLNGTTMSVQGTRAAVHTNQDFTATAWAFLASSAGAVNCTIVSQNGTNSFGYALRFDNATNKWAFATANSDTNGASVTQALSTATVATGRWVHLAGVFDATAATAKLYVDGVLQSTVARAAGWDAQGIMQVGAEKWNGTAVTDFFNGRIDDVRAYQRALSASEVAAMAADPTKLPVLKWDFDEGSGTTTADNYGANIGTFGATAGWASVANGRVGTAATFPNNVATGYVDSVTPALHTNASFTVAAWIYTTTPTGYQAVMTQSGTYISAFGLVDSYGTWMFYLPKKDKTGTPTLSDLDYSSAGGATAGWTHMAGVFDATQHTVNLYINGVAAGTAPHLAVDSWDATGVSEVGRGRVSGAPLAPMNGRVDSVRYYQRVLSATEVNILKNDGDPAVPDIRTDMSGGLGGALLGTAINSKAAALSGSANGYSDTPITNPTACTTEFWFRATGNQGGVLTGLYQNKTGTTGSYDRQVYLDGTGHLTFGTKPAASVLSIQSPLAYNDGNWHHVATSVGPAGQKLYVDGAKVVFNAAVTTAGNFTGYWRWGGGSTTSWPNPPINSFFTGSMDEVAFYNTQLTDAQVLAHYQAR